MSNPSPSQVVGRFLRSGWLVPTRWDLDEQLSPLQCEVARLRAEVAELRRIVESRPSA
ncbi:MAG TPA: hypothetical protein VEZ42_13880 [Pseudonocardia sp.]|jgi:hypothetical protein|nr:hypothetical protein [Pseudonocardia sp.]